MRSTTTPAHSENMSTGRNCMNPSRPSMKEESVSRCMSQPCATLCIQVPISEMSCPVQKRRKFRWPRARRPPYHSLGQDFPLAAADGPRMHRLSLEWSRIEPERGRIDPGAVAHYHQVLGALRRRGLEPLVTLHHFTNPLWIADRGGWENRDTIERFAGFAGFCAREFGAEVDWWCTVNEPEVLGFRGWSEGLWPPQKRDDGAALAVGAHPLEAPGRAYPPL